MNHFKHLLLIPIFALLCNCNEKEAINTEATITFDRNGSVTLTDGILTTVTGNIKATSGAKIDNIEFFAVYQKEGDVETNKILIAEKNDLSEISKSHYYFSLTEKSKGIKDHLDDIRRIEVRVLIKGVTSSASIDVVIVKSPDMGKAVIKLDNNITEVKINNGVLTPDVSGYIKAENNDAVIEQISISLYYTENGQEKSEVIAQKDDLVLSGDRYIFSFTEKSNVIKDHLKIDSKITITVKVKNGEESYKSISIKYIKNMGQAMIVFNSNMSETRIIEGIITPAISGNIIAPVGASFESISVTAFYKRQNTSIPVTIATLSNMNGLTKINNGKYSFSYTEESEGIAAIINTLTNIEVTAIVINGEQSTYSIPIVFESPAPTLLSLSKAFQWQRVGASAATGLDEFGLTWTSIDNTLSAVIKADASTKLVKLTAIQWSTISTLEALIAAIDNAVSIDRYTGVSATAIKAYDDVLGVDKGNGEYYMIHITNGTVAIGAQGSTTTITGQYKEGFSLPAN